MFTDKAQVVIDRAKCSASGVGSAGLDLLSLLGVICRHPEGSVLLADCFETTPDQIRSVIPSTEGHYRYDGKLPLTEETQMLLRLARDLAEQVADRAHPGLIDILHLVAAVALSREACLHLKFKPRAHPFIAHRLAAWRDAAADAPHLDELSNRLLTLRSELQTKVFGQDHAIQAFVDGLFAAELVTQADKNRSTPRTVFVFAGPPGVGKTYLAQLGAAALGRPFRRFDMTAYSGHQQNEQLIGMARAYQGAQPGLLTDFVKQHPDAVLLFDEIEKSHSKTIQLFLQVLDGGTLEDKFHEQSVSFKDTTIIFTTNAGRKLYDLRNSMGVQRASSSFHRRTILDALQSEIDPMTQEQLFPPALCSRLAGGYPVLFNHLGVNELEQVVHAELRRMTTLFEAQYYKASTFDAQLPLCLVLREGARADARTLRAQTEAFFKQEIFKLCQLFNMERLEEVLANTDRVVFALDEEAILSAGIHAVFEPPSKPRVLLVADSDLTDLYPEMLSAIDWRTADTTDAAQRILGEEEIDMVLVDLNLGHFIALPSDTIRGFDRAPIAARGLEKGQELLRRIRNRIPEMPVYLLMLSDSESAPNAQIYDELFSACVRAGGARGLMVSRFIDGMVPGWEQHRKAFETALVDTCRRLYREKAAERIGRERKVMTFDTAPRICADKREITIRLRNLDLARAVAAVDATEVLDDVERPTTTFEDVIGAQTAKEELRFFIDYLKRPRHFAALGLKPPKGVVLHGPAGTGKTMLARAMAGESDVAFIAVSATSFVTMWQGSGPHNIKALFERARRYAPSIIFIDEIDAIGRVRTGSMGAGHGEEMALNALLTEMDGFIAHSTDRPVFVLAATNFSVKPEAQAGTEGSGRLLDAALVRRFSRTILVDLPDTAARRQYLIARLSRIQHLDIPAETIFLLAEKSVGMSIAALDEVVEMSGRRALQRNLPMTGDMLLETLDILREGEAKEWSPAFLESTARHEAGHTILYWLAGWWAPEVSIIARGNHGGGMRRSEIEIKQESLTRDEILAQIRTCLGGRAAEILYYGPNKGLTTGAAGDLEHATMLVRDMLCRYGMDEDFGPAVTPELFNYALAVGSPLYERVNAAAQSILKREMEHAADLLRDNRMHLDAVADALLDSNRLYRKDLEKLLPAISG